MFRVLKDHFFLKNVLLSYACILAGSIMGFIDRLLIIFLETGVKSHHGGRSDL
jgi:hypothetical protein